jgi:hypothetical protein
MFDAKKDLNHSLDAMKRLVYDGWLAIEVLNSLGQSLGLSECRRVVDLDLSRNG